jgi:outer membrane protein OmpA-like peptidoglycan-associated protein/tetratricopeptide (TPR) repeat protein
MLKNTLTYILLTATSTLFAQNIEFKSSNFKDKKEEFKKVEQAIEKGDAFYKTANDAIFLVQNPGKNYKKALMEYEIAQKFNPNNAELNLKIGVCWAYSSDPNKAIPFIKKAKELDPACSPFLNYYLGYSQQLEGNFDEALKSYIQFETEYKKADDFSKFVVQRKKECTAGKTSFANPIRTWVDLVPELNSELDDYAPSISTDGSELIFTSNRSNGHPVNDIGEYDKDIYTSTLNEGKWSAPKQITGGVNSLLDDVSSNLSFDGTRMLLNRESNGQKDIYESILKGNTWSDPVIFNFQISSQKTNEEYAAYSDDGWSLYFTRDNDTRANGYDIYNSKMQSKLNKDYAAATTMIPMNSKFNDGPIYLHIDGETMYIASQGNESIGGYDIFVSRKYRGLWTAPVNLGYPINTPYDDFFFASTANGKFAYISSNRAGGKGGFDIYKVTFWGPEKTPIIDVEDFLLSSIAMPMKDHQIESTVDINKKTFTVFKGATIDAITKKPIEAEIDIIDNTTGSVIETFTTNSSTGKFIITLVSGKNYGIAVKAKNYLFHSENFDIPTGSSDNLVSKLIELKNIAIGSKITLRNVFFDTGKSTLRVESNGELDRVVKLLKDVPNLKIEISGHTDNTGSANLNEKLSQQRAESVVNYLKNKGVNSARLTAKGYGASKPVATNSTEDGKQQNRRTEFEIKGN